MSSMNNMKLKCFVVCIHPLNCSLPCVKNTEDGKVCVHGHTLFYSQREQCQRNSIPFTVCAWYDMWHTMNSIWWSVCTIRATYYNNLWIIYAHHSSHGCRMLSLIRITGVKWCVWERMFNWLDWNTNIDISITFFDKNHLFWSVQAYPCQHSTVFCREKEVSMLWLICVHFIHFLSGFQIDPVHFPIGVIFLNKQPTAYLASTQFHFCKIRKNWHPHHRCFSDNSANK